MTTHYSARGPVVMAAEPGGLSEPVGMFLTPQAALLAAAGMNALLDHRQELRAAERLIEGTDFRHSASWETQVLPELGRHYPASIATLSPTGKRLCSCGDYWPCRHVARKLDSSADSV